MHRLHSFPNRTKNPGACAVHPPILGAFRRSLATNSQNFATVSRPGILDIQLKPIFHSFRNCKIFTANEYVTYPYEHHGGNQRLTGNADPSLEERFILTAIFFINVLNFTAYQYAIVILQTDTYSEEAGFNHRKQMGDITQDLYSFHNYSCFLHNGEISPEPLVPPTLKFKFYFSLIRCIIHFA